MTQESLDLGPGPESAPAGQGEPSRRILCACGCGRALTGKQTRWASGLCSARAWDKAHPRIGRPIPAPRLNPTAPSERYKGLQRKCLLILGRLQQGPATNVELMQIGGLRYGARLAELRAPRNGHPGHRIRTDENRVTGLTVYSLEVQG